LYKLIAKLLQVDFSSIFNDLEDYNYEAYCEIAKRKVADTTTIGDCYFTNKIMLAEERLIETKALKH
jgi:hypothetical protein